MIMKKEEVIKTSRLESLEKKLVILEKSKNYLQTELSKLRADETELKAKIRKEKEATALTDKAKRLRNARR